MEKGRALLLIIIMASAILLGAHACGSDLYFRPKTTKDFMKVSVKVLNSAGNSGGSGLILSSGQGGSIILTNKHVCNATKGGVIETPGHLTHRIHYLKIDPSHDLCLIGIDADLGIDVKIANKAPEVGDKSIVVGHPALLPVIVTEGHFSEHMIVTLIESYKDCETADYLDLLLARTCLSSGKIPQFVTREGHLVSSLIMPGSSGSPVFNDSGELAGVIFAGQGSLSFGIAVPLESIWQFIKKQRSMMWQEVK